MVPGYYSTNITRIARTKAKTHRWVLDHIPANRWGDKQDLMGAMIFLASRAADYVNGHVLVVDGGFLVR